jgi:hypothetical protein
MFGPGIPSPVEVHLTKWHQEKNIWGSYSFVGNQAVGEDYSHISAAYEDRVFFAGEATVREHPTTVAGAFISGLREAGNIERLVASKKRDEVNLISLLQDVLETQRQYRPSPTKKCFPEISESPPSPQQSQDPNKKRKFKDYVSSLLTEDNEIINPELAEDSSASETSESSTRVAHKAGISPRIKWRTYKKIKTTSSPSTVTTADDFYSSKRSSSSSSTTTNSDEEEDLIKREVKHLVQRTIANRKDLDQEFIKKLTKRTVRKSLEIWQEKGKPSKSRFLTEKRMSKLSSYVIKLLP